MLKIGTVYHNQENDRAYICASVTIEGKEDLAWFSVEQDYGSYLTDDRADAFVVGFLTTAMRLGEDIECVSPISRRLYYQLTTYLIPSMVANMEIYHSIAIHAPLTDVALPCQKAVGTGWTGGVDCMYTLMTHINAEEPSRRLTHLLVANVGTLESDDNQTLLHIMAQKAKNGIAAEMGLQVISVDSNMQQLQDENYLAVAGFRLPAAVLALQKLFGVFLHSGAYEFSRFSFVQENSAYYELLPLSCYETDTTVFYSTGSQISRIQKLKELSEYPPAQKYLHPCIYAHRENCGRCGKCIRTETALYALGTLERFGKVFDLDAFYQNINDHLADVLSNGHRQHYGEVLDEMKRNGFEMPPEVLRMARIRRYAAMAAKKHFLNTEEKSNSKE